MKHIALVLLASSLLVGGCRLFGPDHESPRTDLERARNAWADHSDGSYSFDLFHSCFCVVAGHFHVEVENYEIVSMTGVPDGEPVAAEHFEYMYSIDQMFDLIEDARSRGAAVVEVDFSDRGFPTRINLDYSLGVADDELYIEVDNVETGG